MIGRLVQNAIRLWRSDIGAPRPLSVAVNVTGRCNLRCAFCEKGRDRDFDELGLPTLKRLVDLAVRFACPLFLGGGEPFLHPRIGELLDHCGRSGKRVSIVSNGTTLASLSAARRDLLGRTVACLSVSIDSADAERHDALRGVPGSWDRVMAFLRDRPRPCRVGINAVLLPDLAEAAGLIDLAAEVQAPLNFQPVLFASNYPGSEPVAFKAALPDRMAGARDLAGRLARLADRARRRGVRTNLGLMRLMYPAYCAAADGGGYFAERVVERFRCFVTFQNVTVDERGGLCPCALLPAETRIGSEDIYETWKRLAERYRRLSRRGRVWPACRSCGCHFAENCRASILRHPLGNARLLGWLAGYYLGRALAGENRRQ